MVEYSICIRFIITSRAKLALLQRNYVVTMITLVESIKDISCNNRANDNNSAFYLLSNFKIGLYLCKLFFMNTLNVKYYEIQVVRNHVRYQVTRAL